MSFLGPRLKFGIRTVPKGAILMWSGPLDQIVRLRVYAPESTFSDGRWLPWDEGVELMLNRKGKIRLDLDWSPRGR